MLFSSKTDGRKGKNEASVIIKDMMYWCADQSPWEWYPRSCGVHRPGPQINNNNNKRKCQRPLKSLHRVTKDIKLQPELVQKLRSAFSKKRIYDFSEGDTAEYPRSFLLLKAEVKEVKVHWRNRQRNKGSAEHETMQAQTVTVCRMLSLTPSL
jgi:hypothetical protein